MLGRHLRTLLLFHRDTTASQGGAAGLPLNFERHTGDLDAMVKRGAIRALVLYNRSGFFYVTAGRVGDLIAYALTVTPEREQAGCILSPIATDVKQIVVTGKGLNLWFHKA